MPQPILIEFQTDLKAVDKAVDALEKLGLVDKQTAEEFRKTSALVEQHNRNLADTGKKADAVTIDLHEMVEEIKKIPKKIIEDSANKSLTDAGKATADVTDKSTRLALQLRKIKEEMNQLEIAGKTNTARYRELAATAGRYQDQIGDTSARVRILASDTKNLDAALSVATGVAGGFAIAQGAAGLFGAENEDLQKTMLKVQSALALVNGLTAVSQTLNKDSAASVVLLGAAQRAYTVIVGQSTGAVKLLRIAMAGLGIGLVIFALYEGIKALSAWIEKTNESTVAMNGASLSRETYLELQNKINEGTVDEKTKLEALLQIAKNHNLSLEDRNRAVKEINELSPKYLGTLDLATISQGKETAAVNAYIESLDRKIKARALEEILVKKQQELYEQENASLYDNVNLLGQAMDLVKVVFGNKNVLRDRAEDQADATADLRNEIDELKKAYNAVNVEILNAGDSLDLFTEKTNGAAAATKTAREAPSDAEAISPIPGPVQLQTEIVEPGIKIIEDYYARIKQIQEESKARELAEIQETREARAEAYANAVQNATMALDTIGSAFQAGLNNELTSLKAQLDAKQITQEQYNKASREAKRKEAVLEKTLNVFKALLNIPTAILEGLVKGGPPLAAFYGALATIQAGVVIGTKIPAFKKGVENLTGGERGKDSILSLLAPGERVVTSETNAAYFPILSAIHRGAIAPEILNSIAEMPNFSLAQPGGKYEVINQGLDYDRLGQVFGKELEKLPLNTFHWDINGIYRTVTNGADRIKYYEDRYSSN